MSEEAVVAIARIPLAQSRRRMLLAPLLLVLAALLAIGAGVVAGGWTLVGLATAALMAILVAGYLALVVVSVRLDVEVSALRLRWLGVDRRYTLVPGPVTRVPLRGKEAARLRPRWGAFGWGLGPASLRGRERIQVVRLARTASVILIPTDAGRVAVAPRSEEQLLEALSAAARVQQRLDQVAARARALPLDRVVREPVAEPEPAPAPPPEPEPSRVLTGIERVLLEERLAAERAAALAAAEEERRRAAEEASARRAAATVAPVAEAGDRPSARTLPRPRVAVARPGWLRVPRPTLRAPRIAGLPQERLLEYGVAITPLVLAVAVWGFGTIAGRLELPEPERRITALTFALVGPGAALAALAARAWFPRLLGLVTVASFCSLLLVARAIVA